MLISVACFDVVIVACFCPGDIEEGGIIVDFSEWLSLIVPSPKRCNFTQTGNFCFSVLR